MQRVARMKRILKRNYIQETLEGCKGNSKKSWRLIREFLPTKSKQSDILEINGKVDTNDIAYEINNYFNGCEQVFNRALSLTQ